MSNKIEPRIYANCPLCGSDLFETMGVDYELDDDPGYVVLTISCDDDECSAEWDLKLVPSEVMNSNI